MAIYEVGQLVGQIDCPSCMSIIQWTSREDVKVSNGNKYITCPICGESILLEKDKDYWINPNEVVINQNNNNNNNNNYVTYYAKSQPQTVRDQHFCFLYHDSAFENQVTTKDFIQAVKTKGIKSILIKVCNYDGYISVTSSEEYQTIPKDWQNLVLDFVYEYYYITQYRIMPINTTPLDYNTINPNSILINDYCYYSISTFGFDGNYEFYTNRTKMISALDGKQENDR